MDAVDGFGTTYADVTGATVWNEVIATVPEVVGPDFWVATSPIAIIAMIIRITAITSKVEIAFCEFLIEFNIAIVWD